jgi:hypothetical protein
MVLKASTMKANEKPLDNRAESSRIPLIPEQTADDGPHGSGVAATYYTLPGDREPRRYAAPFEVPLGTVVRFGSVDEAGNVEAPEQILVDNSSENLHR